MVLDSPKRFARKKNTLTISTDGALAGRDRRIRKEHGAGGWAFVVHEVGVERSGNVPNATNNQMELRAVIEALKYVESGKSVIIRTDSQYVSNAVNRSDVIKSNIGLWDEYRRLKLERDVKVVWIKGHNGDPENERADVLAGAAARAANRSS